MHGNYQYIKNLALPIVAACGISVFPLIAQAHGYSQSSLRRAQQELRHDGYYAGTVDGIDGPMTHAAIRKYQAQQPEGEREAG
ncbi:MAG TPA: peptidoglycan-binding domain-containing protein [Bryobacteraceae bacterium]|nr:peptidoglycan-binding domain-containing protein [Bryobacteraceae bacterium]